MQTISKYLQGLTRQELEASEILLDKALAKADPFSLIEEERLWIKTKAGELIPLKPNKAQLYVLSIIKKLWKENKPIRLFILKARQVGVSTLIESIIYSITSQNPNTNSLIVADDIDGANYLFEMSKLYQERCADHIKPLEKKSNEKKLEFEGTHSQILIDTANHKEAGRKYTFRAVHLSEWAFFPYPEAIMLGISKSVPSLGRTIIVKETTANGFNFAKEDWDLACDPQANDYIAIFIPWYWDEKSRMPITKDFVVGDRALGDITKAELDLADQMQKEGIQGIPERLNWRRWSIRNECAGKVINFNQESPSTPEEAFIASGDCAFDKEQLILQLRKNPKPIAIGNLVEVDGKYEFRLDPQGDFEFYEPLNKSEQYVVGGDACSGSGVDFAGLVAVAKHSNNTVATYRKKVDSDVLAQKAKALGTFLKGAIVAIENNSYGFHANLKLRAIYGNIFKQETIDSTDKKVTTKFGWNTNSKTRPDMLGQLKQEIRAGATDLRSQVLIRECLTFIRNPDTGKEEAQEGCCDDLVISRAIASAVRQLHPFEPEEPVRKQTWVDIPGIPDY